MKEIKTILNTGKLNLGSKAIYLALIISLLGSVKLVHAKGSRFLAQDESHGIPASRVGILIQDLRTDLIITNINSSGLFIPASVTKVLTAVNARKTLGDNKRLHTIVKCSDPTAPVVRLQVLSCGDPTLASRHFPEYLGFADSVAVNLKRLGVTRVSAEMEIQSPNNLSSKVPAGWMDEDLIRTYGAQFQPINYMDNTVSLVCKSSCISTKPNTPGLKVYLGKSLYRKPNSTSVTAPADFSGTIANPVAASTMKADLHRAMLAQGIIIVTDSPTKPYASVDTTVYVHKSPVMRDILKSMLLRSDNLMAEGILRMSYEGLSHDEALEQEMSAFYNAGIDTALMRVYDGSGLSRSNRLSPYFLGRVLKDAYHNTTDNNPFYELLPVAGRTGTLKKFLKGTALEGKILAKTGSMRGVQCYAGYKVDDDGKPTHVIVVLINGFSCDRARLVDSVQRYLLKRFKEIDNQYRIK